MRVKFTGDADLLRKMKAYALLAPHLDGGGAHNNGRVLDVAGRRVLLAWRNTSALAMSVDCGFTNASCGFVGTSDGYQDVTRHYGMEWNYGSAMDGNIALTGEINIAEHPEFVLAVGFGSAAHSALTRTARLAEHALRSADGAVHRAVGAGAGAGGPGERLRGWRQAAEGQLRRAADA